MRIEPEEDQTLIDRVGAAFRAVGREIRDLDDREAEFIERVPRRILQIVGMVVGVWIVLQAALQLAPATFQRVAGQIPWPWALLIAGVLLIADSIMSWRALTPDRDSSGPFSRRWVLIGCAVAIVATWAATSWMWSVATPGQRLDAIKAGLTVGAGTGGAFALLLAARRQWHQERQHAHDAHVARLTLDDATERRVTDAYNEALKQLSSEQTIVRQGAMFELERIADTYRERRTTIAQLLCSCLRQPIPAPTGATEDPGECDPKASPLLVGGSTSVHSGMRFSSRTGPDGSSTPPPGWADAADERIVAFDIICKHLPSWNFREPYRDVPVAGRWDVDELKFAGAHLPGAKISNSRLYRTSFAKTHMWGDVKFFRCHLYGVIFDDVEFHGSVSFFECELSDVTFKGAVFHERVGFGGEFERVEFDGADFRDAISAAGMVMTGRVSFENVKVDPILDFRGAKVVPELYDIHIPGWVTNHDRHPPVLEPEDPAMFTFHRYLDN